VSRPLTEIPGTSLTLTGVGGGLYVSWDAAPTDAAVPSVVLARLDARTGAVEAKNAFSPGFVGAPLSAAGSLWVTDSNSLGEFLLRLDPATLMVTGELKFSARQYRAGPHVAYAGGSLWLDGGDQLLRVSPESVEPSAVIALRGAQTSDVGASPDGSVLVVSEHGHTGVVQWRNPDTGALLAAHPVGGAEAAVIDGFTGSGVWITEVTGMSVHAERYSDATMTPAVTAHIAGRGDVDIRVANGMLWVTEDGVGVPARDYCADAYSGGRLATLPVAGPRRGELLAVDGHVLYYAEPAPQGTGARIVSVPVPASCG
jgi:hypothetical protein